METNANLLKEPAGNRAETVASDLEGTLTTRTTWEGMRDFLIEQGQEQSYKRFFLRQMPRYGLLKLGLISREAMKNKWIVGQMRLFSGYTVDEMAEMSRWIVEKRLWPGRRQLVVDELLAHRALGRRVIINSGQFEPILAQLLLKMAGVEGIGTPIFYEDDLFSGQISMPLNNGQRKAAQLQPFLRDGRIHAAYGDTEPDLPMLLLSHSPVAVDPDESLRHEASRRGWRILETTAS